MNYARVTFKGEEQWLSFQTVIRFKPIGPGRTELFFGDSKTNPFTESKSAIVDTDVSSIVADLKNFTEIVADSRNVS